MKIAQYMTLPAIALAGIAFTIVSTPSYAWKPDGKVELIAACKTGCGPDRIARVLQKIWKKHKLVDAKVVVANKGGGTLLRPRICKNTRAVAIICF